MFGSQHMISLISTAADRREARAFLRRQGLDFEDGCDDLAGSYDGGELLAVGARAGNILKMIAVAPSNQGGPVLGEIVTTLVERGFARQITKEEGLKVLDKAEKAGLVHTSNNSADKANLICNCCPCCCTLLRGKTQLKHPHAIEPSRFAAFVKSDDCTECGICADERCPVKAITITDDVAFVNEAECIGCGLCVTGCPAEAVELVERKQVPSIPATLQDLAVKVLQEKGRLDAFMKIMQS